jgi:hypothetical protein
MYQPGDVIDLCLDFLGISKQERVLTAALLPERHRRRLQTFLQGIKVFIRIFRGGLQPGQRHLMPNVFVKLPVSEENKCGLVPTNEVLMRSLMYHTIASIVALINIPLVHV